MSELDKYKVDLTSTKEDKNEFISCIILDKSGRPLRLKRSSKENLDSGKYDLCSGHMHNGEIPMHTLIREVKEELEIGLNDISEIIRLGNIKTPHSKLNHTTTHMYCMVVKLEIQEIRDKLKQKSESEIVEAEYLDSIDTLEKQIRDENSNWRVMMTDEVEEILNKTRSIIKRESYIESSR